MMKVLSLILQLWRVGSEANDGGADITHNYGQFFLKFYNNLNIWSISIIINYILTSQSEIEFILLTSEQEVRLEMKNHAEKPLLVDTEKLFAR